MEQYQQSIWCHSLGCQHTKVIWQHSISEECYLCFFVVGRNESNPKYMGTMIRKILFFFLVIGVAISAQAQLSDYIIYHL